MKYLAQMTQALIGIRLSAAQLSAFDQYERTLLEWNMRFNLTAIRDPEEVRIKHFLDSLTCLIAMRDTPIERVIDIGSGAGFPGIPLALFLPDSHFTLAERLNKRAVFLKNMALSLSLKNITVTSEDYRLTPERFDVITFRAFVALPDEIAQISEKLSESSVIAAYKGKLSKVTEEITELLSMGYEAEAIKIEVPFLDEERHIILVGKRR